MVTRGYTFDGKNEQVISLSRVKLRTLYVGSGATVRRLSRYADCKVGSSIFHRYHDQTGLRAAVAW